MATNVRRVRSAFALVLGVVALSVATAPTLGAATPSYEFVARDSGGLPGRVFSAAAGAADGESVVVYGGERPGDDTNKMLGDTWVYRASTGWVPKCGSAVAGATAPCGPGPRSTAALGERSDGCRAVRWVRGRARRWGRRAGDRYLGLERRRVDAGLRARNLWSGGPRVPGHGGER